MLSRVHYDFPEIVVVRHGGVSRSGEPTLRFAPGRLRGL